jgi:hypothetical protein
MKKAILAAGVAALVFAACGGDSDQDKVATILLAEAQQDGLNADEDCVKDVASQLSDEDAKKVLEIDESDDIEDAGLSAEGFSTALGVLNCVDVSSFIDDAIADLKAQGLDFDEQCIRNAFEGVDFSEFTSDGGIPEELTGSLIDCVDLGG